MNVDRKDPQGLRSYIKRLGRYGGREQKRLRGNGQRVRRKAKLVCALEAK